MDSSANTAPFLQRRKQRSARQDSNVFAMFNQVQILAFKEVFGTIDQNSDDHICEKDLRDTFQELGQSVSAEDIQQMLDCAQGKPIKFTTYLTLMAEKLRKTEHEDTILSALSLFDQDGKGLINADYLRECMMTMGDHFSEREADILFSGVKVDKDGKLFSNEFVSMLKHGE